MFGYIRPHKSELLVKEYQAYKSVYCGLCKKLGKNFGINSRLFLSYDATFLAMLSISINSSNNSNLNFNCKRCVVNPVKKCCFCESQDESFLFAGAVSLIMTYFKIKDDIHDSSFLKKLLSYSCIPVILKSYKIASKKYPEVELIISDFSKEQNYIENYKDSGIDVSAKPTADALSRILTILDNNTNSNNKRILAQLGFFIGRWIYLIDAADDIDEDIKNNNFNPFVNELIINQHMERAQINNYCNEVLNQTLAQVINAFNLLNLHEFKSILNNIIFKGMPLIQNQVLFDI